MIEIDRLRGGDRRALARAITLLESNKSEDEEQASELLKTLLPHSGNSIRIGLTGVPGVGKSTLIEVLGSTLTEKGHKVAVLAVDPSSSISGGSILGDKTRMESLSSNENAFIRPSPAGKTLGGVARRTREAIVLCEAAGYDVIIVETVGVGQSETLVSEMTDMFLLMLLPGGGDELQGIKRGIMELADLVVVNKADDDMKSRATLSAGDIQQALRLIKRRHENWQVPVVTASARDGQNISNIWEHIETFWKVLSESGEINSGRQKQARDWLWYESREMLLTALRSDQRVHDEISDLEKQVEEGKLPPTSAARFLVQQFLNNN